jgi:hypothetical protein
MTRRPSGHPPPTEAELDGKVVELVPIAQKIASLHLERHPEDSERYGGLAYEWAVHDMQHVLHWAYTDVAGLVSLPDQVAWLARVLDARGYPVENLWSCLRTAAEVVPDERVADRLRSAAP